MKKQLVYGQNEMGYFKHTVSRNNQAKHEKQKSNIFTGKPSIMINQTNNDPFNHSRKRMQSAIVGASKRANCENV